MDGKAVVPVLKKAQAAKIPVIVVNSSVEKGNEALYISYVGPDNFDAARWPVSAWSRNWAAKATC